MLAMRTSRSVSWSVTSSASWSNESTVPSSSSAVGDGGRARPAAPPAPASLATCRSLPAGRLVGQRRSRRRRRRRDRLAPSRSDVIPSTAARTSSACTAARASMASCLARHRHRAATLALSRLAADGRRRLADRPPRRRSAPVGGDVVGRGASVAAVARRRRRRRRRPRRPRSRPSTSGDDGGHAAATWSMCVCVLPMASDAPPPAPVPVLDSDARAVRPRHPRGARRRPAAACATRRSTSRVGMVVEDRASGFCGDVVRWTHRGRDAARPPPAPAPLRVEAGRLPARGPAGHAAPAARHAPAAPTRHGLRVGRRAGRAGPRRRGQPDLGRGPPRRRAASSTCGATTSATSASSSSRCTASTTSPAAVAAFAPSPRAAPRRAGRPPRGRVQGVAARRRRARHPTCS